MKQRLKWIMEAARSPEQVSPPKMFGAQLELLAIMASFDLFEMGFISFEELEEVLGQDGLPEVQGPQH